jgi:hypothetical protein
MIRGQHVVEHTQAEPFLGFEKPLEPSAPVSAKLEQKFLFVAAVRNMPNTSRNVMSICPRHSIEPFLESPFCGQKDHPKPQNRLLSVSLSQDFMGLSWCDPTRKCNESPASTCWGSFGQMVYWIPAFTKETPFRRPVPVSNSTPWVLGQFAKRFFTHKLLIVVLGLGEPLAIPHAGQSKVLKSFFKRRNLETLFPSNSSHLNGSSRWGQR